MALIDELAARLKETTDELEAELQSRYYTACPLSGYPLENRRFYRDMASVRAARKLLEEHERNKLNECPPWPAGADENGKMPLTVIQQPVDYTPFVKPAGAPGHKFDALLCELGALGVRLDVLAGK